MRSGDPVLLRSVYRDRVRWTFPHRVVELTPDRIVMHLAPGSAGKITPRGPDGYLRRWMGPTAPNDHVWSGGAALDTLLPTGWEDWRPNPSWPVPRRSHGWDCVG